MPKGGARENSGRPSRWLSAGGTQTIRVPSAIADRLLEIAHYLDEGGVIDFDTKSEIDLTDVRIYQFRGAREWVRLTDLAQAGYQVRLPEN